MTGRIDADRLVRQFMDFVRIDSPTFAEAPFLRALGAELKGLGLAVSNDGTGRDGAGNLLSVVPGTDPAAAPILLCMHVDTVEPGRGIRPVLGNGVITSDGTTILGADNKSAVAASIEAVRYLQANRPAHGDVELLFTWGEERGLLGSRAFDASRLRSRIGFSPDGGGPLGTVITRAPYHSSVAAKFLGKAAHAGVEPENGISAIVTAGRAVAHMPLGRIDAETTANIGRIAGGSARNVVPEQVEIEGEARSLDLAKLERQLAAMRQAMESAARDTGASVEVRFNREYDGFHLREDELPTRIALAAGRAIGLDPTLSSTGGGSDANNLNGKGIRTVVLGMGAQDVHSTRERIAIQDLVTMAELLVAIVLEAGRQARAG